MDYLKESLPVIIICEESQLGIFSTVCKVLKAVGMFSQGSEDCAHIMKKCFRALCCKGPPPPRLEYDVVCIGLTGSGKTSLLSRLCSEGTETVVPTTGFSIKAVPFQNAILNVKELGGADNIKKYWSRYYQGSQGVIFVLDSASSEEELEIARNELHSALQHPQLCILPFLILANHQDKPAARSLQEIKKYFELEPLARGKRWILQPSSLENIEAVRESFIQLIGQLEEKDMEPGRV
ncbi:ADP-ribosylation factor-like protein 15 isoform X2 [Polyodon spathula]|uniref:ADP-ribosylation factor-like protein 15 isoform X2 n=1 Tax=Polyodon spathula TaxID=7913 RepID=UPI001B7F06E8|nr:ADP-ribosylation factor-like protein 15 isoform X2 [Polyodon spathula]